MTIPRSGSGSKIEHSKQSVLIEKDSATLSNTQCTWVVKLWGGGVTCKEDLQGP